MIQPYAWGSRTAIPALLGGDPRVNQKRNSGSARIHSPLPPRLGDARQGGPGRPGGRGGPGDCEAFGPRLPFLLKIIAAEQPLSLQAHPSREQAEAGYAREQAAGVPRDAPHRTYRDGWPKPELLCAFAETDALCGFREPRETHQMFERLAVDNAL